MAENVYCGGSDLYCRATHSTAKTKESSRDEAVQRARATCAGKYSAVLSERMKKTMKSKDGLKARCGWLALENQCVPALAKVAKRGHELRVND